MFVGAVAALPGFSLCAMADDTEPPSLAFRRAPAQVTSADQVLNIAEFEPLACNALPPAHFGYIATGADDDKTVIRNHEAFSEYEIRARRFTDVTHLDTAVAVFGTRWPSPIYLSAVSAMRAFDPEGELAVARVANGDAHCGSAINSDSYNAPSVAPSVLKTSATELRSRPSVSRELASPAHACSPARPAPPLSPLPDRREPSLALGFARTVENR